MEKIKELVLKVTERIKFNSIRQKMMTGFSVIILFTIVISGLAITNSIQSSKRTEQLVDDYFTTYADLKHLSQVFIEQNSVAYEYLLTQNLERVNKFNSFIDEATVINERLLNEASKDDAEIGEFIGQNYAWTERILTEVFEPATAGNDAIARSNLNNLTNETQRLVDL